MPLATRRCPALQNRDRLRIPIGRIRRRGPAPVAPTSVEGSPIRREVESANLLACTPSSGARAGEIGGRRGGDVDNGGGLPWAGGPGEAPARGVERRQEQRAGWSRAAGSDVYPNARGQRAVPRSRSGTSPGRGPPRRRSSANASGKSLSRIATAARSTSYSVRTCSAPSASPSHETIAHEARGSPSLGRPTDPALTKRIPSTSRFHGTWVCPKATASPTRAPSFPAIFRAKSSETSSV